MLQRYTTIGTETVSVACADDQDAQAEWLLSCLLRLHNAGQQVGDGIRMQVVGMLLSFRRLPAGHLAVCVPDVASDPFKDETADVSAALQVLFEQINFAQKIDVEPVATSFQDKVLIDQGSLDDDNLFMIRSKPDAGQGDSGWYVGRQGAREQAPALEAVFAFQLVKARPELAASLVLPEGFMVMIGGSGVLSVTDADDRTRFTSSDR